MRPQTNLNSNLPTYLFLSALKISINTLLRNQRRTLKRFFVLFISPFLSLRSLKSFFIFRNHRKFSSCTTQVILIMVTTKNMLRIKTFLSSGLYYTEIMVDLFKAQKLERYFLYSLVSYSIFFTDFTFQQGGKIFFFFFTFQKTL